MLCTVVLQPETEILDFLLFLVSCQGYCILCHLCDTLWSQWPSHPRISAYYFWLVCSWGIVLSYVLFQLWALQPLCVLFCLLNDMPVFAMCIRESLTSKQTLKCPIEIERTFHRLCSSVSTNCVHDIKLPQFVFPLFLFLRIYFKIARNQCNFIGSFQRIW